MESANIIKFAKRRHQLSKPWYDKDCYIMKKTTKVSLQRCRNSNNIHDRQKYIEARREYFKLLQRKRDEFNKDKNERIKNAKDPKSFWNAIASFRKKPIIQGEIDIKEWFLFYKNLLNKENKEATFTVNQMIGWKDPDLDAEITLEEIHDVVKKLANGKAVGLDDLYIKLMQPVSRDEMECPDLAPSDYFLFGLLKKELKGKRFDSDEDVQNVVQNFFHTPPKSAYKEGIYKLPERWRRCIESQAWYDGFVQLSKTRTDMSYCPSRTNDDNSQNVCPPIDAPLTVPSNTPVSEEVYPHKKNRNVSQDVEGEMIKYWRANLLWPPWMP
ncbi:hypothetical protein LAZ67_3001634 [Cordylochernes scorpioides]|uniref:Uncharacterized protein n=1 Tax=Cordylochernes scorpioides TaxID=51811 RepID=A0ABY6K7R9_9ARAC|nr:hypothetical protein LAZ67_3001634 [Cordylochernes scorpioides]